MANNSVDGSQVGGAVVNKSFTVSQNYSITSLMVLANKDNVDPILIDGYKLLPGLSNLPFPLYPGASVTIGNRNTVINDIVITAGATDIAHLLSSEN